MSTSSPNQGKRQSTTSERGSPGSTPPAPPPSRPPPLWTPPPLLSACLRKPPRQRPRPSKMQLRREWVGPTSAPQTPYPERVPRCPWYSDSAGDPPCPPWRPHRKSFTRTRQMAAAGTCRAEQPLIQRGTPLRLVPS